MRVCDIASKGLVYALDPAAIGRSKNSDGFFDDDVLSALSNILKAQEFDAIPLIPGYKREVTSIARRRLHQGDEHSVFVLDRSEVECISRDTSILEAIFMILSNEHHVLFLENDVGTITDILTISMIADPKVKSYLRLKFSQLKEDKWGWNEEYLSKPFTPTIEDVNLIYDKISQLAKLIIEDEIIRRKEIVPSDREVSQLIVEILAKLQPLKPFKGNFEYLSLEEERFFLEVGYEQKQKDTAKEIQHEWAGSLIDWKDEDDEIKNLALIKNVDLAFELFSEANDWDSLLLRRDDSTFGMLTKSEDDGTIEYNDTVTIDESVSHLEIAKILVKGSEQIIVVENENSKWPGIITIHDFALNQNVQQDLLLRFTQIEMNCRARLVSEGIQVFLVERYKQYLTSSVNFKNVIDKLDSINCINSKVKNKLNNIRFCRNKLVHNMMGHDLEILPNYLHYIFLEAYINSHKLLNLFEIDENTQSMSRHLISLDAFVNGSASLMKRETPRIILSLVREFIEMNLVGNSLQIYLKKNSNEVNKALDKAIDLGTWREIMQSCFDDINQICIKDVRD